MRNAFNPEKTDVKWDEIVADLESAEWEDDEDGGQVRAAFVGTVFSLFPSGKYYLPWATSVLTPCRECRGAGAHPPHRRRRIAKKWRAKGDVSAYWAKAQRRGWVGPVDWMKGLAAYRSYIAHLRRCSRSSCRRCGGCGCREAWLDERYGELLEEEAGARGLSVIRGQGDPTDVFAAQYRDAPAEDEESEDEDEDP